MITGFVAYAVLLFGNVMSAPFTEALVAVPLGVLTFIGVSLATRRPTGEELVGMQTFHSDSVSPSSELSGDD